MIFLHLKAITHNHNNITTLKNGKFSMNIEPNYSLDSMEKSTDMKKAFNTTTIQFISLRQLVKLV